MLDDMMGAASGPDVLGWQHDPTAYAAADPLVATGDLTMDPPLPTTPLFEDFGDFGVPVPDEEAVEYADNNTWLGSRVDDWIQNTPEYPDYE